MNKNKLNIHNTIYLESFGTTLWGVWLVAQSILSEYYADNPLYNLEKFNMESYIFFESIEYMLLMHKIKLNYMGTKDIVELEIKEQVNLIIKYWPQYGSKDVKDDLNDFGSWFWDQCPVGIVWIGEDGSYIWT